MSRFAILATILIVASGCDKAMLGGRAADADAAEPPPGERFDLARKPDVLFQIFGERDDPRMIPVAAIVDGKLGPINLGAQGWRSFDSVYTPNGGSATIYHDGRAAGTATVRQGMWEKPEAPLYSLPGCKLLKPLAAVTLSGAPTDGYTVEYLASTAALKSRDAKAAMPKELAARTARALGYAVGKPAGLENATLDSLDFYATAIATGATAEPTLIASFIDPGAQGDSTSGAQSAHLFVIADRQGSDYVPTFRHVVNGAAGQAMYRRYVDHLDIDGDGTDEIFLEGWQYGGGTQLLVLSFRNGQWEETFRAPASWCLDRRD